MNYIDIRLLVCGGRDYDNKERLFGYLDEFFENQMQYGFRVRVVITGYARGADKLADAWAIKRRIQPVRCPALWDDEPVGWGNSAGPIRNSAMLILKPDKGIAFPGGVGTADMISKLKKAHIPVIELEH
jgi:YspA, cpYpsA-related SLOG family